MKLSQTGMGTTKLNNIDKMYPGQSILLQTGQLVQYGAGLFGYNTIPLLVRRKIEQIIVNTLNEHGCIEVLFRINILSILKKVLRHVSILLKKIMSILQLNSM